ncbi:MAG: 2OG-Fe(II) oxygenase [Myxococcota bacterium]
MENGSVLFPIPIVYRSLPVFKVRRKLFTPQQCDALAGLVSRDRRHYHSPGVNTGKRVNFSYLEPEGNEWVYQKLARCFARCNVWNIALTSIVEPVRLQTYSRDCYTDGHSDFDYAEPDMSKLTAIVPLVSRRSWTGGHFQVGNQLATASIDKGDCLVFPSFQSHSVTRVSKGTRLVMSAWASGPPLR